MPAAATEMLLLTNTWYVTTPHWWFLD